MYLITLCTFFCGVAREYIDVPPCDGHVASSNNNNNNNDDNGVIDVLG
jgi:hypothetical protein